MIRIYTLLIAFCLLIANASFAANKLESLKDLPPQCSTAINQALDGAGVTFKQFQTTEGERAYVNYLKSPTNATVLKNIQTNCETRCFSCSCSAYQCLLTCPKCW